MDVKLINDSSYAFKSGSYYNSSNTYICRKNGSDEFQLGYALRGLNGKWQCWTTWDGALFLTDEEGFEIFTDPEQDNLRWVRADGKSVPAGAISGGTKSTGDSLIITRCLSTLQQGRNEIPGYIIKNDPSKAYYGYETEHECKDFEILTCNDPRPGTSVKRQ